MELLNDALKPLYRNMAPTRKSVPADFACRADEAKFDRPLTAEIAVGGGLRPRLKETKGKGKEKGQGHKRSSPEPERAQRPRNR